MQAILDEAISYTPSPSLNEEVALSDLRTFVDDTTILTPEVSQAHYMLASLDELISWCRMSFK